MASNIHNSLFGAVAADSNARCSSTCQNNLEFAVLWDLLSSGDITAACNLVYEALARTLSSITGAEDNHFNNDPSSPQPFVYVVSTALTLLFGGIAIFLVTARRTKSLHNQHRTDMSGWSSRFGSWSGRFSPFGRGGSESSGQVTDSDFSYITSEDLARVQAQTSSQAKPASSPLSPSGDDDILIIKNRRVSYPLHFPARAIDNGEITIGVLRIAAARKLEVKDARKVKLFYKGRNLKEDRRLAKDEGFRSGVDAEILCVVGEANTIDGDGSLVEGASSGVGSGSDSDDDDATSSNTPEAKKKKKKSRSKKKKGKSSHSASPPTASGINMPKSFEYLPTPGGAAPARPTSAPPQVAKPMPADPLGQLAFLGQKFSTELKPLCEAFIRSPPSDKAKRDFEYKKLSETVLQQILLKLDGVETAGVEGAREKRKELVKECQSWLNRLDEVVK